MISSQICRGQGKNNTGQRKDLSKRLDNSKNFIVSLMISLFIWKLYNFDPYNNKCKSLSLDKIFILGSILLLRRVLILLFDTAGIQEKVQYCFCSKATIAHTVSSIFKTMSKFVLV